MRPKAKRASKRQSTSAEWCLSAKWSKITYPHQTRKRSCAQGAAQAVQARVAPCACCVSGSTLIESNRRDDFLVSIRVVHHSITVSLERWAPATARTHYMYFAVPRATAATAESDLARLAETSEGRSPCTHARNLIHLNMRANSEQNALAEGIQSVSRKVKHSAQR